MQLNERHGELRREILEVRSNDGRARVDTTDDMRITAESG